MKVGFYPEGTRGPLKNEGQQTGVISFPAYRDQLSCTVEKELWEGEIGNPPTN